MAATTFHTRSNSLPSGSHPTISRLDEKISVLRNSLSTSTSPSSSTLGHRLSGLQDLHECLNKLLLLPLTQRALAQEHCKRSLDEVLDGSLRLLDLCNMIKDALSQTKEKVNEIRSVIRRRSQGGLDNEIKSYMGLRKSLKKEIKKTLKNLKCTSSNNYEEPEVISVSRDVGTISVNVFESILLFICGSSSKSKSNKWSLVSKLMKHQRVACEEEANEFTNVDHTLEPLHDTCKTSKFEDKNLVITNLSNLDSCIQDFEDKIECLFRLTIKTRVSILNIIN